MLEFTPWLAPLSTIVGWFTRHSRLTETLPIPIGMTRMSWLRWFRRLHERLPRALNLTAHTLPTFRKAIMQKNEWGQRELGLSPSNDPKPVIVPGGSRI